MRCIRLLLSSRHSRWILWSVAIFAVTASIEARAIPDVTINPGVDSVNLAAGIDYYVDLTGNLTLDDIQNLDESLWQRNGNPIIAFGFDSSAYWFRTRITNDSTDQEFLLHAAYPRFDYIDIYQLSSDGLNHHKLGIGVPASVKPLSHREHLVPIVIKQKGVTTLLIRAQTTGSFLLPLHLWRTIPFFEYDSQNNLWSGSLLGVWLLVMIFNLVIFSALKHASILSFVSFTLFFGIYQFSAMGLGRQYWGASIHHYDTILIVSIGAAIISMYFFLSELLQLKKSSKVGELALRVTTGATLCCMIAYIFVDYATVIPYLATLTIVMSTLIVVVGGLAAIQGNRLAIYSTVGWTILGIGIITQALASLQLIATNFITGQAAPLAFIIMIISVSFAISAEVRRQRQLQSDALRDRHLLERSQQLEQTKELEGRVHERTLELETALQELSAAHETLKELNTVDAMTGIKNRAYFDTTFEQEWRRAIRQKYPLSLMLLDIDHFKRVNDTYGHQVGDECLREIAFLIKSVLRRPADILARYGGEEFVILLPYVEIDNATFLAEQICTKVANTPLKIEDHVLTATLSIGVASMLPTDDDDRKDFISDADVALYRAKDSGRNNVQRAEQNI